VPSMTNAHALIVGVASYPNVAPLPDTVLADANDVADVLTDPNLCAYPLDQVCLLLDGDATLPRLRDELASLARRSDADSTVFIYISGHGGRIGSGPAKGEYLLPFDVALEPTAVPPQIRPDTAMSGAEFAEAMARIPARKLLVVFDCCHAGGLGATKDATGPAIKAGLSEDYYGRLAEGRGRVILASCRGNEFSYVLPGGSNSLFTSHLLSGLRGNAPAPGGMIRIFDLFGYLQPKVVADQASQHPIFRAEVEDNFPVALSVGGKGVLAPPAAPPADEFAYDVFLSYRDQDPDKTWARKTLLPRLEQDGLKVIEQRRFRLGAPIVKETERAVTQSRYTLSVLSPAYIDGNFTDLESVLAEHLGLENSQRRLLAVMREYCKPRLGMRARMWLDMSEDDEFDDNLERLVFELKQPPVM
jgi:hypothetical protein